MNKLILSLIGTLLIGADQWTKFLARKYEPFHQEAIPNDWLNWHFVENTGIAFSLPIPVSISSGLALIVIGVLLWELSKTPFVKQNALSITSISLIIFGAIGNFIDRVWLEAVTDFIQIKSFAIFNLADIYVSVGVGLFVINEVFKPMETKD